MPNQTQTYFNIHNHTHFSNNRFLDSMNSVTNLILQAKKKGLVGIGITDHGVLSGHIKVAKLMDSHPEWFNGKDGKPPFKVVLGEEIYLDDFDIIKHAVDNNKKTKFFHFVLTAEDNIGYHALRIISSNSWGIPIENLDYQSKSSHDGSIKPGTENNPQIQRYRARKQYHGFFFRGMRRLPTYKDWLNQLMNDPRFHFKGHVIASTACLGSELSQSIVANDKARAKKFVKYIEDTFGKSQCYFEMMPAHRKSQKKVNQTLWNISHGLGYFSDKTGMGIPCIISTDAHYIDKNDRQAHSIFLKSENPNRDVKDFYYYAHLFTYKELDEGQYFTPTALKEATQNSLKLLKRYAPIWHLSNEEKMKQVTKDNPNNPPIRLHHLQEIPESPMPKVVKPIDLKPYAKKYHVDWSKYPYFKMFCTSPIKEDRYYMFKIFKGMKRLNVPFNNTYLTEINKELRTLHALTKIFHEPMSAYFLTVFYAVIDTCWSADSIVGSGRGSAGEWVTNYILGITQVNSIKWHLWGPRFESVERAKSGDMPDIDLDSESSKRLNIIALLKKKYGIDRVLNFSTFGTQAAKSTIYTCCRGMHINYIEAQNIANLLPADSRGMGTISLHDALFGNKKKSIKPAQSFIKAVQAHPGLEQALLGVGGKIRGVSEHASGVALWNEPLTQRNAMMRTNKAPGIPITQFSAHDSAYASSLKYDILTLSALDRIHEAITLLINDHKIKKFYDKNGKFSLYKTYMHYFGPQALDFTSPGMYDLLYEGKVTNAFEFSSIVGRNALITMHARDFSALVAANALMRLTVDPNSDTYESHMMKKYWGNEQPINRYVRYRDNKGAWDRDMKKQELTEPEMKVMHEYLGRHRGVCYSQEDLMKISMDKHIANFPYIEANKLRKAVAKKDPKILESARQDFYKSGLAIKSNESKAQRKNFLDYVWYNCAVPAKNYSFNLAHGVAYTINLIVEMNICYRFGSVYWQTACLSVNAGLYGKHFKNPDYNKLDRALAGLKGKILNPDINHSQKGFVPYHGKILYGLYPISGLSSKDTETILKARSKGQFKSFRDFIERTNLSTKTNLGLIKAGCFDNLTRSSNVLHGRIQLMAQYLNLIVKPKKRLTTVQIPKLDRAGAIPSVYEPMAKAYEFRKLLRSKRHALTLKDKQTFTKKYAPKIQDQFPKNCGIHKYARTHINEDTKKKFEKWYQANITDLKNWLKQPKALQLEADLRRHQVLDKYCQGSPEHWEMETLGCYVHTHELLKTPLAKEYDITPNYTKVSKQPKQLYNFKPKGSKRRIICYYHTFIYGTVISKNANKGLVYLLTPGGIANVYCGKWRYSIYNKKITKRTAKRKGILPKGSWFDRGTRLAILGYRMGSNFFANRSGAKDLVQAHNAKRVGKSLKNVRKKYKECIFRIKGYGANAQLEPISYHGSLNPLPTKHNFRHKPRLNKKQLACVRLNQKFNK